MFTHIAQLANVLYGCGCVQPIARNVKAFVHDTPEETEAKVREFLATPGRSCPICFGQQKLSEARDYFANLAKQLRPQGIEVPIILDLTPSQKRYITACLPDPRFDGKTAADEAEATGDHAEYHRRRDTVMNINEWAEKERFRLIDPDLKLLGEELRQMMAARETAQQKIDARAAALEATDGKDPVTGKKVTKKVLAEMEARATKEIAEAEVLVAKARRIKKTVLAILAVNDPQWWLDRAYTTTIKKTPAGDVKERTRNFRSLPPLVKAVIDGQVELPR